jgi:hypothetical protein
MKKKTIVLILGIISTLIGISLYFASTLSKLSDLNIFDIEDEDF